MEEWEPKFMACFKATIHILWLRNFISGLGIVDNNAKLLKIYYDNFVAIFFSKNDKYLKGSKHMELKYFVIEEEVQKHRVLIEHISTNLMAVDPLTKGLLSKKFGEHVKKIGIGGHHYWHYVEFYVFHIFDTLSSFKYSSWFV